MVGDRYAAEWTAEAFRKAGIAYKAAEKPKSELYRELLGPLNSVTVELLDHPRLVAQLVGLERRVARGGRESIDHAPSARDDLANSVAGLVSIVCARKRGLSPEDLFSDDATEAAEARERRLWSGGLPRGIIE